jgi:predicted SAM-dependent methyltransferase
MDERELEMKKLLHVGCGPKRPDVLPKIFEDYKEVRLDIDPSVEPDICYSMLKTHESGDFYDAIFSSHNLEHLHPFEILPTLEEWKRVLNDSGFVYINVPDIELVAELILKGKINNMVYVSEAGPITPLDMIFGFTHLTYKNIFQRHQCAFTLESLISAFNAARFAQVTGRRIGFDVEVIATKTDQTNVQEILNKI